MAKQLNVSLAIKADTQQAKSALNELQKSLTKVIETKTINVNDKSIVEAKQAAMDLNKHLNAAVNTDTGKLDLGKFSSSLQKSNQTLSGLYTNLSKIGPSGQQAFLSLSKSIALADQQTLSLGNKISQLGTTLANTARWQVSSSILHSMMGAVQGAYYYAKDLNESLNNIRIVTGQSEAQMANFAKYASSAAKALSTSTMDVTKASLIYFQQGLSEEQVKARTEVTLKMANVSRQSAQEVSDQMTAIWNNFYDGSKSLEYYADVITKLGAATASSSSEIANGLQKFASVADTVGLSYEKATAALATIVAETRQSEDVVGTSLKTMLSRFQSLKLGETLEDGVDLNKYSAALETVGVKVLDANGNLRDMDGILDDLGEKWKLLGNAQQVALAQTVAGQRQYAQFIALVDNYDKVLANQSLGENSSGTLNAQQEIFAEGWEAAAKRVKAALEEFYNSILDDKFFITILNGLEKVLIGVKSVVNGLGGLKGVLLLIGSIVLEKYAKEMPAFLDRMKTNFQVLTGQAEKFRQSQIGEALDKMREMGKQSNSKEIEAQISGTTKLLEMTQLLAQNRDKLSKAEIAEYENKIKQVQVYTELATAIGKEVDEINKEIAAQETALRVSMSKAGHSKYVVSGDERKQLQAELTNKKTLVQSQRSYINAAQGLAESERQSTLKSIEQSEERINQLESQLNETVLDVINNYKTLVQQHEQQNQYLTEINNKTNDWINALDSGSQDKIASVTEQMLEFLSSAQKAGIETKVLREEIRKFDGSKEALGRIKDGLSELVNDPGWLQTNMNLEAAEKKLRKLGADDAALIKLQDAVRAGTPVWKVYQQAVKEATGAVDEHVQHHQSGVEIIGKIGSALTRAVSIINSVKNLGGIWTNEEASIGEKIVSTASSLGMILPTLIQLYKDLGIASVMSLGPYLGIVAAVAAAIAGIIVLIKDLKDEYNKEAIEAEKVSEATKNLKQESEEARAEAEKLKNVFEGYTSVVEKLKDCKENTQEWRDALKEVNDYVNQILTEHPELIGKISITRGSSGELQVEGLEEALSDAEEIARRRENAALFGQAFSQQKNVEAQLANIRNEYRNKVNAKSNVSRNQRLISEVTKNLINSENFDSTGNFLILEEFQKLHGTFGLAEEDFYHFYQSLRELAPAAQEAAAGLDNAAQLMIDGVVQGKYKNLAKDGSEELTTLVSGAIGTYVSSNIVKAQDKIYNEIKNTANSWSRSDKQADLTEENSIWNRWLVSKGLSNRDYSLASNAIRGNDQNREIAYHDLSNNGKINKISIEQMAIDIAAYESSLNDSLEEIVNVFDNLSADEQDFFAKLILSSNNLSSGSFLNNLSQETYEKLMKSSSLGDIGSILGLESGQLENMLELLGIDSSSFIDLINTISRQQYIDGLQKSSETFSDMNEKLHSISQVTAKIDFGSIIKQEDYDKLVAYDKELSNLFQTQSDGSYKFIGNKDQLRDSLIADLQEKRKKAIVANDPNAAKDYFEGIASLATSFEDLDNLFKDETSREAIEAKRQEMGLLAQEALSACENMDQFNNILSKLAENQVAVDLDIYSEALLKIASEYDNTTVEAEKYKQAVENLERSVEGVTVETVKQAEEELRLSVYAGELAKSIGVSGQQLERYAEEFGAMAENAGKSKKALIEMAKDQARFDKAVISSQKNMEKWEKDLAVAASTGRLVAETAEEMAEAYGNLLDLDGSELSASFLQSAENLQLMKEALEGSEEAYKRLRENAKHDIEVRLNLSQDIISQFDNIQARIDNLPDGVDINVALHDENFLTELENLVNAARLTKEQAENYLSSLGIDAEVNEKEDSVEETVGYNLTPRYGKIGYEFPSVGGSRGYVAYPSVNYDVVPIKKTKTIKAQGVKVTSASKSSGGNIKFNHSTAANGGSDSGSSSSSSGGGGGGSRSLKDYKDQQDELERYHVIRKQLDDLSRSYDRLSKAKDRSFGAQRLKYLKEENAVLQDQIKLQSEYIDQIHSNAEKDLSNLIYGKNNAFSYQGQMHAVQGLSHYGITPQLDSNNNILNWYQIKEAALAEYNAAVEAYNAGTMTEEAFALAEKQYEEFNKLIEQYEESNELLQDAIDKRQELIYEWQDNNFEAITYELEVKLIVNEGRMKWLQYQLKKIGDSVYHASEAISNLFSLTAEDQSDIIGKKIEDYTNTFNQLNEAWNTFDEFGNRSISQKDYIDGLQQVRDGLYEQLEAWMAIDEQMEHYYSDTLDKVDEELRKIFDRMRHNVDIIDHLQKVLELTGRKEDYEMMGKLLTANMDQNKAIYESSKEAYEMYQRQREAAEKEYEDALAHGGKELQEIAKNNFEAAVQKANEAEAQMYQDLETFLESCNAVIQNELDRTKAAIESMYTNGKGWDYLNSILDISERIGDKYLTKTNQIYETNKLLRQIRQDIDKTDNLMAKQKLKNFTNEINSLQKINKLSKNQLEIAQAQYEVLKAQIALEEAQNAKSTVRLQRDSEGNYGYVYTADQDKIGEAEQNLANAQNDLYNIALRQENDTAKEIMSINQERTEALAELWRQFYVDKTLSEEEYNEKVVETNKKYNELLEAATKDSLTARELLTQLSVTNENDSWTHEYEDLISKGYAYIEAQDEFWTLGFGSITGKREDWFSQENPAWEAFYNGIMDLSRETQETWNEELQKMRDNTEDALQKFDEIVGVDPETGVRGSLLNLEKKIADVTAETARLKDSLSGSDGLISTLEKEADEVRETTLAWGEYYDYLNATVIPEVERLIQEIQELIEWASENTYSEHVIETKYVTSGDVPGSAAPSTPTTSGSGGGGGGTGSGTNDGSSRPHMFAIEDNPGKSLNELDIGIIDDPRKRPGYILQYASGGYTGSWTGGSDLANGRLALLHQKELVLNEQDTENMLQTVQFVRQISGAIDLRAGSRAYTPGFKAPVYQMGDSGFEQQVTIHAEFPNAVNHSEIEEAFDNLINRASQYVNRPVNYLY